MRVLRRGDGGTGRSRGPFDARSTWSAAVEPNGQRRRWRSTTRPSSTRCGPSSSNAGLITDGVVGPATYRALRDATYQLGARPLAYLVSAPVSGDDVLAPAGAAAGAGLRRRPGQRRVRRRRPRRALRNFQRDYGLTVDGICGAETVRALRQLSPRARGGRPVLLREQERVRRAGPRLRGKRIVIDPGHGGHGPGRDGRRRARGRPGVGPGPPAGGPDGRHRHGGAAVPRPRPVPDRGATAPTSPTTAGADLFLSLHADANPSPLAQGVASFHFGTVSGNTSTVGETLAGFIQRELVVRTGLRDCRTHPQDLGHAAADPLPGGPHRDRLPDQPRGPRAG